MRIETRERTTRENGVELKHHDLLIISDGESDSELLDLLGQPESTVTGEVRLADGYGEHYLLIQPRITKGVGWTREFPIAEAVR